MVDDSLKELIEQTCKDEVEVLGARIVLNTQGQSKGIAFVDVADEL